MVWVCISQGPELLFELTVDVAESNLNWYFVGHAGERFFLTRAEMTAFYVRKEKACKRAFAAMQRMAAGATGLAFRTCQS